MGKRHSNRQKYREPNASLASFWQRVAYGTHRLALLKEWAEKGFHREASYADTRAEPAPQPLGERCFVCNGPRHLRHHIIQIQNGGVNLRENVVWLCNACHEEVHPWMARSEYDGRKIDAGPPCWQRPGRHKRQHQHEGGPPALAHPTGIPRLRPKPNLGSPLPIEK
jgi:hypothetical protein